MLLVYTHNISPRLKYIFKHICTRILGIPVSFTSEVSQFVAHNGLKLSYTTQPLASEFFIRSHTIMFEQGLSDIDITVHQWEETKCFFQNGEKSSIPFDIFAASFYLLSRYEEYLPHVKDEYGRYTVEESLAHSNQFLHQPVVDIWAYKFRNALTKRFENFEFKERSYQIEPIIDVPMAYYYKHKGLMRTIGGICNDIYRIKFRSLYQRFLALFGFKDDPYNTFSWLLEKQKASKSKFNVFFLIGAYSTYDKNISINNKVFVSLIKSVADYCNVGLKASYFSLEDLAELKQEKRKIEAVINRSLTQCRNSFSKLNLPSAYRNLVELEIHQDYTMGYVNHNGFRAGTCTPFLFYDIDYEIQTPLMVYPFAVMDYTLLRHKSLLDKKEEIQQYIHEVKRVNGTFIPVFHNYSFSENDRWKGFKDLFDLIINSRNEI